MSETIPNYTCPINMSVKTTVITGATSGIGEATALALAKEKHTLYLLVRDVEKGHQLQKDLVRRVGNEEIYVVKCDLADLQGVKDAAEYLKKKLTAINVLINNAGGMFEKLERSADGFEMTFAVNHLGHFALTTHLMPLLQKGNARIINVSSEAHRMAKPDFNNLRGEKGYSGFRAYANAKLYNVYFAESLAERYGNKGITAYSLHPGVVKTNFGSQMSGFRHFLLWLSTPIMISPQKGAKTSVYLATAPRLEMESGRYFKKSKPSHSSNLADDFAIRNQLWNISAELVAQSDK